jgi:hypothetical protein
LGLATEPGHDGRPEYNFFLHDFNHAMSQAGVDLEEMGAHPTAQSLKAFIERRISFRDLFEREANEIKDENVRAVVKHRWWWMYHAEGHLSVPYSPQGFIKYYQASQGASVKSILPGVSGSEALQIGREAQAWMWNFSNQLQKATP